MICVLRLDVSAKYLFLERGIWTVLSIFYSCTSKVSKRNPYLNLEQIDIIYYLQVQVLFFKKRNFPDVSFFGSASFQIFHEIIVCKYLSA